MFHIRYPGSRDFMTWDEIRCLCRALGFPGDLIRRSLDSDFTNVKCDNKRGLEVKTLIRLLNLRLMYQAVHLTYNLHTADWNTRAVTKSLHLLGHRALDYDELYRVRVAYTTYEHTDMKGMVLDTHILLRALKMCGRAIAPLKLARQIKHARSGYVEKGRIQLDEFLGLILWCDLYKEYCHDDSVTAPVKEGDLFKLVDVPTLLSHHDERLTKHLNARYLQEERTFEAEKFGSRKMFTDSTVNVDFRREQVQYHQHRFRALRNQINQSQQRVQSAHAGSVRPRPISAPDLVKYRNRKPEYHVSVETSAKLTLESMRRRRQHPDTPTESTGHPDRPQIDRGPRVSTPRVITPADLQDTRDKMDDLNFDISTLETRRCIQVEDEMMFYIPGHLDKCKGFSRVNAQPPNCEMKQHQTRMMMGIPVTRRAKTCVTRH